ncbi:epoxide hydrolase family protein [Tsuneonella troitsensis]|uniref:epoxide hydrolase family protein n=1 Tax=Tsuneonella troitsensis TaxID=292222 RepID=UPI0007106F30|nr:epoxide hydrolase family protein [Tsuneonella troitsensis]
MTLSLDRLKPFSLDAPEAAMADLRRRLAAYRPPPEPAGAGWRYGVDGQYLKALIDYWRESFDWRAAERRLNELPHYRARLDAEEDGQVDVHLIVQRAARPDAPVVLMTPGWPSSLIEYHDLIARLTAPERYGADPRSAVTVVAAELPGFGLSQPPRSPMAARRMAELWRQLMVDVLQVPAFVVHGGDWGAVVSSWLAFDHPEAVRGLHLSMLGLRPPLGRSERPLDEDELAWVAEAKRRLDQDGGYREQQATKPTTLGVGLSDSPAALVAWLVEKYHGWSGAGPDQPPPFDRDAVLTAATVYWIFGSLPAANWIYWADRHVAGIGLAAGERVLTPTGFAMFGGGFFPVPPRSWAERAYDVVAWDVHERGGHFPAWLTPEPVARSLLGFVDALA